MMENNDSLKREAKEENEEKEEKEENLALGGVKELKKLDQNIDEEMISLKIEDSAAVATSLVPNGDKENNNPAKKKDKKAKDKRKKSKMKNSESELHCVFCNVTCIDRSDFHSHCQSQEHQHNVMSDEGGGKVWKFRPPPRTMGGQEGYKLCPNMQEERVCRFALQCAYAHSVEELAEWKERLDFRQKKAKKASRLFQTFNDQLMDRLSQSPNNVNNILARNLTGVDCSCNKALNVAVSSKGSRVEWIFSLKSSQQLLQSVSLLSENGVHSFQLDYIKQATFFSPDDPCQIKTFHLDSSLEWHQGSSSNVVPNEYQIKISFKADIFGAFRQTIVFSFGHEPYLRRDISVDVKPLDSDESETQLKQLQDVIIQQTERWDKSNCTIKDFDPPVQSPGDEDKYLFKHYPMPQPNTFKPSRAVVESTLTKANYRNRMHELLYIEEMAQFEQVSQFNVKTNLQLISNYLLNPSSTNASSAKFARPGELFGKMTLKGSLSEDTSAGRLILTNCTSLLMKVKSGSSDAYVSAVEDSGKSTLYLRLSHSFVKDFSLKHGGEVQVEVQFQLNRLPLCEMHLAIDKLVDLSLIYPDIQRDTRIPWTPGKHWAEDMDSRLNAKQREAILAITSSMNLQLPPILLIGPYGTGKTFTLAQAIMMLLKQPANRILVCTHSNSAADLYIRDYLDPFITQNGQHIKLLRIYYTNRWVKTVHKSVQKYCLIDEARNFKNPTRDDVMSCNVVVATLSTSRLLSTIGLPLGLFTHILIDEAAQAMECEAIMPLALAHPSKTRLVLAGDHMQLSPEVFSSFALEKKFNKSLLERLYNLYPINFPCKVLLVENYRSHEAIINYTSDLFYEQKLLASGHQSSHDRWHPLTMFTARGDDVQDANSTSFYNNAEVYEIVERVAELQKSWPKDWGLRDENSIGIVTPYYDQVQRIRSELRKKKLFGISVERVLNVQGKQFRAIFLSTVRTRKTCVQHNEDEADFGFLSNPKLLNTAITRAQSLVAVVGDPVALCSIGKCRRLWERFVSLANKNKSLLGTTWAALRVMLDSCELKKAYVLNPLAPEFIPRAKQKEAYLIPKINSIHREWDFYMLQQQQQWNQLMMSQYITRPPLIPPPPPPPSVVLRMQPLPRQYAPMYFPYAAPPLPLGHPMLVPRGPPQPAPPRMIPFQQPIRPLPPPPPPQLNQMVQRRPSLEMNETRLPSEKHFTFLKDGVHFPPIPKTPPPVKNHPEKRLKSSVEKSVTVKTWMEKAVDVLPTDSNLDDFLKSPQLQMAWFYNLNMSKGKEEAQVFKDLVVSMQQSPELLSNVKEQLQIKKERMKMQGLPKDSWLMDQNSKTSALDQVLMPSASSADTFYTLANAAASRNHEQDDLEELAIDFQNDPILGEVLKNNDNASSSEDWGSVNSVFHHTSTESLTSSTSPSIPLYKRRGGANQGAQDDQLGMINLPQPWSSELATRSSTMPSSSLSSIWTKPSQQQPSLPGRTYANVLRQPENGENDPLMKIRQIGTRGSQELYDSSSTSPNSTTPTQQPFSPFNGRW